MENQGKVYPLLFSVGLTVPSKKFVARVTAEGAAIMERDEDGWWMHGVEPGGMTAVGETPPEAYGRFCAAFREFLSDVASSVATYEEFVAEVTRLFHEKDEEDNAKWHAAVQAFRACQPDEPFSQLPKRPAESPRYVSVQKLSSDHFVPGVPESLAMPEEMPEAA